MTNRPVATSDGGTKNAEEKVGPTRVIVSYLTLRRIMGILGVLLPVLLAVGCVALGACSGILDSISAYHGTKMRDVFAGILFTVGWFLFSYRGYERKDDIAGDLGCFFALGVALFSTTSQSGLIRTLHFISAASLFMVLAYFSLFLFTKTDGAPTPEKKKRNKVYVACGVIMLLCIALIPLYSAFFKNSGVAALKPVFWLETFALWAFGVSWMTKGETLWKDA
jgi:hypothetical protein